MNNRKYPASLFIMGIMLNLIKLWPLLTLSVVLFIIHFLIPLFPFVIPTITIVTCCIIAIVQQFKYKSIMMSESSNNAFNEFANQVIDKEASQNWRKNIIDFVNEKIEDHSNDNNDNSNE